MTGPIDGPAEADGVQLPPELNPRGPGGSPATGPQPRAKRPHRKRRLAAWVAGSLAAVVAIGGVTGWIAIDALLGKIKKVVINPCYSGTKCSRPTGGVIGDLNILVVGSDSRAGLTRAQQNQLHVGADAGQRSD